MKVLIQRVRQAGVNIDNEPYSHINKGILALVGIEKGDTKEVVEKLADNGKKVMLAGGPDDKKVIETIRNSGGIAVLAHPACYPCFDFNSFVKDLVDMGLEGIEVYYYYRFLRLLLKFRTVKTISDIADKYNLVKTGGTDSHGKKLL